MNARAGISDVAERAAVHGRQAAVEASGQSSGAAPVVAGAFHRVPNGGEPPINESPASQRLSDALKKRIRPWSMTSALTVKDVCRAISCSDDALLSWVNNRSRVNIDGSGDLVRFFWSLGDRAFLAEIYGLPPLGVVAELRRPLIEARAMLDQALEREVA